MGAWAVALGAVVGFIVGLVVGGWWTVVGAAFGACTGLVALRWWPDDEDNDED